MKNSKRMQAVLAITVILTLVVPWTAFAAVWTDQADYYPGSVVTISGDNSDGDGHDYVPGETVQVSVAGPNGYSSSCAPTVDDAGAWSCQVTLWDSDLAVGAYNYTASGQYVSETGAFTDAPKPDCNLSVSITSPSNGAVFTASTVGGTAAVTFTWSSSGDFSYATEVTYPGGSSTSSSGTLPLNLSKGTYSFQVKVTADQSVCSPHNKTETANITVKDPTPPADTTPPTINCGSADALWHSTNQSVNCTASDPSGLASSDDASFTLSTTVAAGAETDQAYTNTRLVCDTLNNCATAGPVGPFKIDLKAPVVNCGAADSIWHNANQSVTCTATDAGSGLANSADASFTLSTSVAGGTETDDAWTGTRAVLDAVGNSATAGPVGPFKIDKKAPVVSCGAADTAWHATDQSVSCTATDGGSGPASQSVTLSTSVAAGTETDNAYTNSQSVSDNVGNSATAGPVGPFKIDKKAPGITITTPPNGTTYLLNEVVAASYSCSDGGSGVATCSGPVANGANINTASVGSKSFTVNASDNVGNASSSTNNYSVIYKWSGFFQPVDNDKLNSVKAGSAIPVKFSLSGNQGLGIFAAGYPRTITINCATGEPEDAIEETVNAGGSSLNYDPAADQYIYVWKTVKTWVGTCRQLQVMLNDGTLHTADFKFK